MPCPPPADPAGPCDPGMDLCKAVLSVGSWAGVQSLAVFVPVWSTGEVTQAGCATVGFTGVPVISPGLWVRRVRGSVVSQMCSGLWLGAKALLFH